MRSFAFDLSWPGEYVRERASKSHLPFSSFTEELEKFRDFPSSISQLELFAGFRNLKIWNQQYQ